MPKSWIGWLWDLHYLGPPVSHVFGRCQEQAKLLPKTQGTVCIEWTWAFSSSLVRVKTSNWCICVFLHSIYIESQNSVTGTLKIRLWCHSKLENKMVTATKVIITHSLSEYKQNLDIHATFKHGEWRGTQKSRMYLPFLSHDFSFTKSIEGWRGVYCLNSSQPSWKANLEVVRNLWQSK